MRLSNEELQSELADPSKEVGESLLKKWMTVSQPQETNYLAEQNTNWFIERQTYPELMLYLVNGTYENCSQ